MNKNEHIECVMAMHDLLPSFGNGSPVGYTNLWSLGKSYPTYNNEHDSDEFNRCLMPIPHSANKVEDKQFPVFYSGFDIMAIAAGFLLTFYFW